MKSIDMTEATRLTRLGRLDEAMAVLRGDARSETRTTPASSPAFIDMVQGAGSTWSAAFETKASAPDPKTTSRSAKPKLAGLAELVGLHKGLKTSGLTPTVTVPAGASFANHSYANSTGTRTYKLYVPSIYIGQSAPLIVMLHGCTQSPDDFAAGTQMNALAEKHGFLVAWPAQTQAANMNRCWNWFNTADQQRDAGEPSIIAGITRKVMVEYAIDPRRVFIAGLSAGGAMAAVMGAAYPDLYAAVGVHSGLAVGAAHDMPSAFAAMSQGGNGGKARGGDIPTIVFHGDADHTVHNANGAQVMAQAGSAGLQPVKISTGQSAGGVAYTKSVRLDAAAVPRREHWVLHGAGHAWSGGNVAGSYTDPRGPDASREIVSFFLKQRPV